MTQRKRTPFKMTYWGIAQTLGELPTIVRCTRGGYVYKGVLSTHACHKVFLTKDDAERHLALQALASEP